MRPAYVLLSWIALGYLGLFVALVVQTLRVRRYRFACRTLQSRELSPEMIAAAHTIYEHGEGRPL